MNKRQEGKIGEELAIDYLKKKGYTIVETNFNCKLGEIDIIAKDGKTICFIEVKYRKTKEYGTSIEAIDANKARKLVNAAKYYCILNKVIDVPLRFDVIGIDIFENKPNYTLIKNAITL